MALLFYYLFTWSSKIERAGYFATLYTDTIRDIEFARLSKPYLDRWERGDYHREILDGVSDRARTWRSEKEENKWPTPGQDSFERGAAAQSRVACGQ
jgi:hypothetical protein